MGRTKTRRAMGCRFEVSRRLMADGKYGKENDGQNFRLQAEQGSQALAPSCAGRAIPGGVATGVTAPVRPRAGFWTRKSRRRPLFLRVPGYQSRIQIELSRRDPRPGTRRELLFLPRLRHQRTGDLQAHRIYASGAGEETRREEGVRKRLSPGFLRILSAQRWQAPGAFPGWIGLPA